METIVAACNQAFLVTTCQCVQHSNGGCKITPLAEEYAEESYEMWTELEGGSSSGTGTSSRQLLYTPSTTELAAEVGVDGRMLDETEQQITTELEMKFSTDVEVSGKSWRTAALNR